jgi:hypothetical protein
MDLILKIVRRYRPEGRVSIRRIGSFVNDVFLVKVDGEKLVAKRYTNWVSLKWVTLSLRPWVGSFLDIGKEKNGG